MSHSPNHGVPPVPTRTRIALILACIALSAGSLILIGVIAAGGLS